MLPAKAVEEQVLRRQRWCWLAGQRKIKPQIGTVGARLRNFRSKDIRAVDQSRRADVRPVNRVIGRRGAALGIRERKISDCPPRQAGAAKDLSAIQINDAAIIPQQPEGEICEYCWVEHDKFLP